MKTLPILVLLIICFGGFVAKIQAQPCAGFLVNVFVKDQTFKPLRNAQVEAIQLLADGENKRFTKSTGKYENPYQLRFSLPELGEYFKEEFLLKVSAKGLKTGELKVSFPDCATRSFEFILKPVGSQSQAEVSKLEYLVGKVTNKKGRAVANAKVTAKSENGRIYEAKTDSLGNFNINLPRGVFKIEIGANKQKYPRGETTVTSESGVNFLDLEL